VIFNTTAGQLHFATLCSDTRYKTGSYQHTELEVRCSDMLRDMPG
jgi:hypothetical protein